MITLQSTYINGLPGIFQVLKAQPSHVASV